MNNEEKARIKAEQNGIPFAHVYNPKVIQAQKDDPDKHIDHQYEIIINHFDKEKYKSDIQAVKRLRIKTPALVKIADDIAHADMVDVYLDKINAILEYAKGTDYFNKIADLLPVKADFVTAPRRAQSILVVREFLVYYESIV